MIVTILPSLLVDGIESYIRKRRANYKHKPLDLYGKNNDFSIIIPAYNAEKTIEKTLRRIESYRERTIVVDDGSKDETAKVVRDLGFEVIRNEENGKKLEQLRLVLKT